MKATVFIDGITGEELEPGTAVWFFESLANAAKVLSPPAFEEYKAGLLAACLVEERPAE